MGIPFVKKYIPEKSIDIIGQDSQIVVLKNFIQNYKKQKKKAILIHGPAGCGKTSSVYTAAKELNLEIIEINASDTRNKEQIQSVVGAASMQMSLFGKGKVILIDELDGIAGRHDYGGIPALVEVIEGSKFPIVITANNPYDNKFSSIRKKSELVQFNELSADEISMILKKICDKEKIKYDKTALKSIARRNSRDARAAVNDLEILSILNNEITKKEVEELSERNRTENIISAMMKIFKTTDAKIALEAFENVEEEPEQCKLWLDENLPKEYEDPRALARAYESMSRSDLFNSRIRRWQHWRFLVYVNALMTAGVAVAKDEKNRKFVEYKPTGRILKMWWAKQKSMKKKAIAEKIAEQTHTSKKEILKNIDFYRVIFRHDREMAEKIAEQLELEKEEVEWLRK